MPKKSKQLTVFGEEIKRHLDHADVTVKFAAQILTEGGHPITASTFYSYQYGKRYPTPEFVYAFVQCFVLNTVDEIRLFYFAYELLSIDFVGRFFDMYYKKELAMNRVSHVNYGLDIICYIYEWQIKRLVEQLKEYGKMQEMTPAYSCELWRPEEDEYVKYTLNQAFDFINYDPKQHPYTNREPF